jgi:hypothetical protein
MAQKKITELQLISAMTDGAAFPVDNGIQTYRATGSQLKTYLAPLYIADSWEFLTTGSGTWNKHYAFVVSAASATVGATYTHNSVTYTVIHTVASSNYVVLSGSAAPLSTGTLTKASGTGDSTIAFSSVRAPIALAVTVIGGGGGGGNAGNTFANGGGGGGGGGGTAFKLYKDSISATYAYAVGAGGGVNAGGSSSTFGGTITANGGGGGTPSANGFAATGNGGAGATASGGDLNIPGQGGGGGGNGVSGTNNGTAGSGGNSGLGFGGGGYGTTTTGGGGAGQGYGGGGAGGTGQNGVAAAGSAGAVIIYCKYQ